MTDHESVAVTLIGCVDCEAEVWRIGRARGELNRWLIRCDGCGAICDLGEVPPPCEEAGNVQ